MPSRFDRRGRGAPAVYSVDAHREFVQGFRKRKQERRQKAQAELEAAEKQARRDARRQKREFVRSNREQVMGHDSESEDEKEGEDTQVTTFDGEGDSVVTTVVAPMKMNTFEAPRRYKKASEDGKDKAVKEGGDGRERASDSKKTVQGDEKTQKRLGVLKNLRKHGKRRVSYTHAMSKTNRRKKKMKMRREGNSNKS